MSDTGPPLDERVVLVTGAAQGIGRAYARAFLDGGYTVVLADVDPGVRMAAEEESARGGRALGIEMDVADDASIRAALQYVTADLGPPLVLVNNAALFASLGFMSYEEIEPVDWDAVMAVNVRGPFLCAKHCIPGMESAGWGRVINVSSTAALAGGYRRLHYATSKGAVIALTRALAREVGAFGITVNAIAPGSTESPSVVERYPPEMFERARAMRAIPRSELPEDLVGTALFLASDAASFLTGQTLVVDGGHIFL